MTLDKSLIIHSQYIKDLSFENPKIPGTFQITNEPNFNISVDIVTNKVNENIFEVILNFVVDTKYENEVLFHVSLEYAGIFTVEAADESELEKLVLVQCPNILFPFARRIISDITRDGGYPPVSLEPIDFLGLYAQKKEHQSNESSANTNH